VVLVILAVLTFVKLSSIQNPQLRARGAPIAQSGSYATADRRLPPTASR
jgi:hypothetical protein